MASGALTGDGGSHRHVFNATPITTRANPVLRCACGAWSTAAKARTGATVGERAAKGLTTRLAHAAREVEQIPWATHPDEQIAKFERASVDGDDR